MSSGGRYRFLFQPLRLGTDGRAQSHRLLGPPDQLRRGRPAERAACGLLRRPGGRRGRSHHHRGALDPSDRLALREADPRVPPRGHPGLPQDHRGGPPLRHADLRPDQPQRRAGLGHVQPAPGLGTLAGGRPVVPRGAQGGRSARDPARSSTATPGWPRTAPKAVSTGSSCSARTRRSSGASSRRPPTAAPTTTAARWRTAPACSWRSWRRCAESIGPDLALGVRLCGDELIEGGTTIDDAVAVAQAVERSGQVDYINTSIGVATATLYMIEASMQVPPGYALWISSAIRKAVDAARGRAWVASRTPSRPTGPSSTGTPT